MKSLFFLTLSAVISFSIQAQSDNKIVIGKIDSVYSKTLNEQRKIWVYVPDMLNANRDTSQRFPVVYLLDGDGHFQSVAGMIQQLSEINGNTVFPQMIVVAIPNTDRTRDLTPTHIISDPPMMDSNFSKATGGGENFISFIEKELMPHVDSAYPTEPYKVFIGHSFGGLAVINALINHTKLFNAYIAIDPSMWYDKEHFLETTKKKLAEKSYAGTKLYLGIANTMPAGMTLDKMKKDTTTNTRHVRSIFALDQFIKAYPQTGLKYESKYYARDDHGSVPLITEYDGLRFIFDFYRMTLTPEDFTGSSVTVVEKYKKHYAEVSKEFGYKVSPPELLINGFGYNAMANKQYAKAAALFEMNIANYPNSSNVYDSYGDLFAAKKDTVNAITWYQKVLAIKDVAETKQKLNALQGKEVFKLTEQELQRFVAKFEFEGISRTVTTSVKDGALLASVPGEGEFELVPVAPNIFTVKNLDGYTVQFETDGDKVLGFTSTQPNGTYKAHLKK